jgi:hypothetical protein
LEYQLNHVNRLHQGELGVSDKRFLFNRLFSSLDPKA